MFIRWTEDYKQLDASHLITCTKNFFMVLVTVANCAVA